VVKQNRLTASDLHKRKSTGALPWTPKAQDQITMMFSLHGLFLGAVLQSRELLNSSHLKGCVQKIKITYTRGAPAGTGSLVETPLLRHLLLTADLSDRTFDSEGNTHFNKGLFKMCSCCMLGVGFHKQAAHQHLPRAPAQLLQQPPTNTPA